MCETYSSTHTHKQIKGEKWETIIKIKLKISFHSFSTFTNSSTFIIYGCYIILIYYYFLKTWFCIYGCSWIYEYFIFKEAFGLNNYNVWGCWILGRERDPPGVCVVWTQLYVISYAPIVLCAASSLLHLFLFHKLLKYRI